LVSFFSICLPQKDEMRGQHNFARIEQGLDQWQLNNWLVCEGGGRRIFWGANSGWGFGFLVVLGRLAGGESGGKWVGRNRRIQVEWLKSIVAEVELGEDFQAGERPSFLALAVSFMYHDTKRM
jgi:hypothetical protein